MQNTVVLMVDDEEDFVEIIAKRLTKRGIRVESAFRGHEALERLRQPQRVDIVLLDVKMPGMDGIEVLSKIKEIRPEVEVILLTGHATVDTAMAGLKLGAFDYLTKPCDIKVLMQKLQTARERQEEQLTDSALAQKQDTTERRDE